MGGLDGGDGGENPFDDPQMMNMFKGLLGSLGNPEGGADNAGTPNDDQMNDIINQFTSFIQSAENNNEFKGALDQVVKEMISKDSMYAPMKNLKEAYPKWLEDNWQGLNDADLERYNKQLDKVTEIC